jgi:hypothetical protein
MSQQRHGSNKKDRLMTSYQNSDAKSKLTLRVLAPTETAKRKPTPRKPAKSDGDKTDKQRDSQADKIVLLTLGQEFFNYNGNAYVSLKMGDHRETWPINSAGYREALARMYFEAHEKAPSAGALVDALTVLSGRAKFAGPTLPVATRIGEHDGRIYIDLCNDQWQVVEITPSGWRVIPSADCPVRFVRRRGMLPLPLPERGGSIDELRPLLNLADDDSWILFVAWIVAAMRPNRPFPVLSVAGEQGSAKSTLCRIARRIIDPNVADLRRLPKDEHNLAIAATNGWVIALENISGLPGQMSDALCAVATGAGHATRQLYSDDEERLFNFMRPIILNGIDDVPHRSDLIDRSIMLTLPAITDQQRRSEASLWDEFEAMRPRVLGTLLDAVAVGLKNLPATKLDSLPRMADFALWVSACEPALPWKRGQFLNAYNANRAQSNSVALESTPIVASLLELLSDHAGRWGGTIKQLAKTLNDKADDATKRQHGWPATAKAIGNQLRRVAPNLRRQGIDIIIGDKSWKGTPLTITRKDPEQRSGRPGRPDSTESPVKNSVFVPDHEPDHCSPQGQVHGQANGMQKTPENKHKTNSPGRPGLPDLQNPTSLDCEVML